MVVKSADRTLDIFELFARERQPLLLTDISRGLDAPLSSCFNLIAALKTRGYIYDIGQGRQFYPTRKMLELGGLIAANEPWAMLLETRLARLRDETQETTILGRLQGLEVVYLAVLEGQQNIRYTAYAGDRKPLHASSIGKALLSVLEPVKRAACIKSIVLDKRTPATITSRKALELELAEAAERGYAITRGENVVDVMAIATPLKLGNETYAIAIAGPLSRMENAVDRRIEQLLAFGGEMSKAA